MLNSHDKKENDCRMLGHTLTFHYCRSAKEGLPCSKIFNCWFEIFPVQQFISNNYSAEE